MSEYESTGGLEEFPGSKKQQILDAWSNDPRLEAALAGASLPADTAQKLVENVTHLLAEGHILPDQVHELSQHVGDIGDTYFVAAATDFLISLKAPNAPRWLRRTASIATSTAAAFLAEIPKFNTAASRIIPHPLLGAPDGWKDLVGAFAGTAIWLAVNIHANRRAEEQKPLE